MRAFAARSILPEHNGLSLDPKRWSSTHMPMEIREPVWFGERMWAEKESNSVIVVEGVFDGLRLDREFPDLPFAAFHYLQQPQQAYDKLAFRYKHIIALTDSDPTGDLMAKTLKDCVLASGSKTSVIRARLNFKDPASASSKNLREVVESALKL